VSQGVPCRFGVSSNLSRYLSAVISTIRDLSHFNSKDVKILLDAVSRSLQQRSNPFGYRKGLPLCLVPVPCYDMRYSYSLLILILRDLFPFKSVSTSTLQCRWRA
jgi:hypothetical protein